MKHQLYIASTNAHKISEIKALLTDFGFEVFGVQNLIGYCPPEETGKTFAENALLKAEYLKSYFLNHAIEMPYILADDSGLCCDDLNGAPGIYSARYSGENATDQSNNQKLIQTLKALPSPTLKAHYTCALAWLEPAHTPLIFEAYCHGQIVFEAKGQNGFGYDPHMWIKDLNKTYAELNGAEKNKISHRGLALQKLLQHLNTQSQSFRL